MKIGILIDRLNVGGVEKIAIEQVRALRKAGQDASLVILRKKAVVENAFPDLLKNIPIIYLDDRMPAIFRFSFSIPGFHFFSWFHLSYPVLLPFAIKKQEFDYIIAHGTYTSLSAAAFKKRNGINFSSFIWDPASYILGRVYKGSFLKPVLSVLTNVATQLDTYLIKHMSHVLVGGKAHNNFIHSVSPDKSIKVIYPSVHPQDKHFKKSDFVLMVTAWKDGKHPEYILELLKQIPTMKVKMAGKWVDPAYKKYFEELVTQSNLGDRIDIIGAVSESELSKLYSQARVLLQTNDDRGFGMPAMEAASNGTTFIIPEGQGVCELFTNKIDGYYTKEQDTKKIVKLLEQLLSDKDLATDMGNRARKKVEDNYSWKQHAQSLISLAQEDTKLKSLHVLFTGLVSPKMLSGGDQLFLDIAPRLPKTLKIIVITPSFAKRHWKNIKQPNIELRYLPSNIFELSDNPLMIFASYVVRSWQTYRILKNEEVEGIYSCSDIAYADIWPAYRLAKKRRQIKWISRIYHVLLTPRERQGSYLVNGIAFYLQRLSFSMMKKESSSILALNKKLYDEVLGLGFPKEKLSVLGAGIDFDRINKFKPVKKYDYDVVALGRVAPVKGIFDTVKIWEKVIAKHPHAKLAWIGGGGDTYQNQVEKLLSDAKLTDSFHMLGFVDNDKKYSVLKSAHIFICPDHENGWGLAVSEAMAIGLPVVSYDLDIFGGVYEQGYLTAPLFNTDAFADRLIHLLDNKKDRKALAEKAVAQAKKFDHQQIIDDLLGYIS